MIVLLVLAAWVIVAGLLAWACVVIALVVYKSFSKGRR